MKNLKSFSALFVIILLAGCQTTKHTAATADEAAAQLNGNWQGHFINTRGTRYPLTFQVTAQSGKITGSADIPSSTYDKNPSITGTYAGNKVTWTTSTDFKYDMHMSKDEAGTFHLFGDVSGPNKGTIRLAR